MRCSAHILIVQDGLKVASSTFHNIRESIKYVRASEARAIQFRDVLKSLEISDIRVNLDLPTR